MRLPDSISSVWPGRWAPAAVSFVRSLRFKLVALFVLVFCIIEVLLGAAALVVREQYLYEQFDEELTARARTMAVQVLQTPDQFDEAALMRMVEQVGRSVQFRDLYVQLRDDQGDAIARSSNLGVYRLPFEDGWQSPEGVTSRRLETLQGDEVQRLVGRGESLRMVNLYVNAPSVDPFYLQAATSLRPVEESITFLRRLFLVVLLGGLLAAAVASWIVVNSAIRRINRVARQAHDFSPDQMTRRLDVADADDEVGQMVDELNDMLDRLEAGFLAQEQFIHDASHELKTPVSVLLSQAQVLRLTGGTESEYHEFALSVEEEMRRLGRMVENLLRLTRSDGDSASAKRQHVSMREMVCAAARQCEQVAKDRGVEITVAPADDRRWADHELVHVRADPDLLTSVLHQLLRCAVRRSDAGSVVQVSFDATNDMVAVLVRDHGEAVPADQLDRLFDGGSVVGDGNAPRGAGLGLVVARTVVEAHQGQVTAEPGGDGGCVFKVALPRAMGDSPALSPAGRI